MTIGVGVAIESLEVNTPERKPSSKFILLVGLSKNHRWRRASVVVVGLEPVTESSGPFHELQFISRQLTNCESES